MKVSTFEILSKIDCNDHTEKKGKFTYLSWAWAWGILKKHCPDATFEKHLFDNKPYMLDDNGYAYVMVSVTVEGETSTEVYPVLDNSNKPLQNPNSFFLNTALQRGLVKAIAYTGLGLYIYAGEDLPEEDSINAEQAKTITNLIHETNSNMHMFLEFAKCKTVETIPSSKFDEIYKKLIQKKTIAEDAA